ncbi:MAG: GtrA family protein [Propionibacteriaceae bacterium]|jgi:putative flippase GtrA|nr:GtrA family protein [Propionibacteriaceae bacterium]
MKHFFARYRGSLGQLARFSIVGGSGVVINLLIFYVAKRVAPLIWSSATLNGIWWPIPGTDFNVRWYSVFSLVAFVVANLSNYQLNRMWSFRSTHHAGWFKELWPFFVVGLAAQGLVMGIEVVLMNDKSPLGLPRSVFDDSTGFRTMGYWAHVIAIGISVPVSFFLNKFWTFRAIRRQPAPADDAGGPCT